MCWQLLFVGTAVADNRSPAMAAGTSVSCQQASMWPEKELTMSAISSVGSSSGSLYLQQLQTQQARNDRDADDGAGSVGGVQGQSNSAQSPFAKFQSRFEAAAKSIGVDSAKLPDIEKQIQAAVDKVQQNGAASGDPRSAVRDAVNGVLKSNGIDPTQFDNALKAQAPQGADGAKASGTHRHHGGHRKPQTSGAENTDAALNFAPKQVQPGQTTGTLVDVAA